jgi:hypothetical protein
VPRRPGPRDLSILAAAFEVSTAEVLADAAWVAAWTGAGSALLDLLARRHAWDRSVPPYYLAVLPAFVAAVFGPGNRSFASPWFILAALAFVGVLVCFFAQQVPKAVGGDIQVVTPGRLVDDAWLRASPVEFKRNLLLYAADDWDINRGYVNRLAGFVTGAAISLVAEAAFLAIWVLWE